MSWLQVFVVAAICFTIMIGAAEFLAHAHSAEKAACIKEGHTWSSTKYVCVANLKK